MKRLWFSVIFLSLSVAFCIYEQTMVKNEYNDIMNTIDYAIASDSLAEKAEYCDIITEKWDKYFFKSSLMLDHSILESADISVGTLNNLAQIDMDDTDEALIEAKSEIEQVYEHTRISLPNIL